MSTKFFALLTQLGADKLANAAALGTRIEITHMAVGDGGGKLPTPDTKQTKLINEKRRAAINTLSIDPKNTNQIIAEQVIPENEGGWWIREIGLFDKDGILIAVGNCAETYKPQLQEGSGRTQTIRMILIVSSADAVTLKVDPSVILATREYVDDSIQKHANSRNHPDATLKEKGFVILSSAVDSNSETHAATPKAVKAAYDFANAANNNANGRVPSGRKVNGKALNADISLNSGDVNAYSKSETDERVNARLEKSKNGADIPNKDEFVKNLGLMETQNQARNAVPNTRKVNGKSLISDVILNSEDVGAFSQTKYMTNIPDQSYLGAFSCGKEGEWVKGVSIGSKGGDVGQIWVDSSAMLHTRFLNSNGNHKQQSYAILGDSYTKQESDNHFIQLNTNTKTSGYILSKAANFLDDPSSRHLGRSGFLRPNNIDNLGDLAIHVAHPSAEGAEHARGISFNYGSGSDKFGLSTYAFDKDGKFQGKKKILTEDDKDSLGSVPVGVPLPWPQDKPPSGYLICNGDRFDKSRYPRLALAYPSGVLPDLRGEFIRGLDAGRNIDSARKALSFQEHSIQSHSHSGVFTGAFERESGGRGGWGATNTNGNTAATGGTETRPRNIAFLYIVRGA